MDAKLTPQQRRIVVFMVQHSPRYEHFAHLLTAEEIAERDEYRRQLAERAAKGQP
jgi:hypothetical protein